MPYKIVKKNDKYLVINELTGKVKGTHDTKDKAISQMRFLYSIEKSIKKY